MDSNWRRGMYRFLVMFSQRYRALFIDDLFVDIPRLIHHVVQGDMEGSCQFFVYQGCRRHYSRLV